MKGGDVPDMLATLPPQVEMQVQMCIPSIIYKKSTFSNRGCPASGGFWDRHSHFLGEVDQHRSTIRSRQWRCQNPQIRGAWRPTFNQEGKKKVPLVSWENVVTNEIPMRNLWVQIDLQSCRLHRHTSHSHLVLSFLDPFWCTAVCKYSTLLRKPGIVKNFLV